MTRGRQTTVRAPVRNRACFVALLAIALAAACNVSAACADYDPLGSGTTTITLDKRFVRFLNQHHIKLLAERGALRHGRRLILPVSGGRLDPTTGRGEVEHTGVLVFEHGRGKLPLRNLEMKAKRTPLIAKVGGSQLKVAKARTLIRGREGFGVSLAATRLTLTKKVATRLDKKLGSPDAFQEGQLLGTARTRTQPSTVAILEGGRATFAPDPAFLAKLESRFVSVNPIAPAERASGPSFSFPIIPGGALAPDASAGILRTGGALEFLQLGSGQIFWREQWFDLGAHDVLAEADIEPTPAYPGKLGQVPIAGLGPGAAAADPGARTVAVSAAPLALDAPTAAYFNQAFASGEEAFHAGEALGSLSFVAQGQ
jgi:hypothetical protein